MLLGILLGVHGAANGRWLSADRWNVLRIPDGFAHAGSQLHLVAGLQFGGASAVTYLREIHSYYSLLAHIPRAIVGLMFEPNAEVLRLANLGYTALLVVGVYLLGRRCHGRAAGLLAALFVSLMPAVYGGSRVIDLDFPAMCLTPWAVLALLRWRDSGALRDAGLFGLVAGVVTLVKGQALLFVAPPAAVVWGALIRQARAGTDRVDRAPRRAVAGGLVAATAGLLITAPWWVGRLDFLATMFFGHVSGSQMMFFEGDVSVAGGVAYYIRTLPYLVAGPFAVALLPAAVRFVSASRYPWPVVAWLAAPATIHVVLKVRHFRYLFPLVPAVALVVAVALCSLRPRWRWPGAALLALSATALWLVCSFVPGAAHHNRRPWLTGETSLNPPSYPPWDYPTVCGECAYAGFPFGEAQLPTGVTTAHLGPWLDHRHPVGRDLLLDFDGEHPLVVQTVASLQDLMPGLRAYMISGVRDQTLTRFDPPPTWGRYSLVYLRDAQGQRVVVDDLPAWVSFPAGHISLWKPATGPGTDGHRGDPGDPDTASTPTAPTGADPPSTPGRAAGAKDPDAPPAPAEDTARAPDEPDPSGKDPDEPQ